MKKGFTLIELLVVVLIIGILSAVALPQYTKAVEKSRAVEAQTLLGNLVTAEQIYRMSQGKYIGDMSVLDLQLPGVGSAATNTITTKNFVLTITTPATAAATSDTFAATAARAKDGTALTTNGYSLKVAIAADGEVTRSCTGTQDLCKSIGSGNDFVYSAS